MLRSRELSAVDLVNAVLGRIEEFGATLNCFITVTAERARAEARAADDQLRKGSDLGPLHGIPISIKDNIATAGVRTTAGSPIYANRVPAEDATVAARLFAKGAILIGKNNLYDFAYNAPNDYFGETRNPWALQLCCGGSSSGSVSAVAAGLGYASIGNDGGGSTRAPASFSGVVGVKPTYGLVSRAGGTPTTASMSCVTPITRSVTDAAIVLQAIAGPDALDRTTARRQPTDLLRDLEHGIAGLRLGVPFRQSNEDVNQDVAAAFEKALAVLVGLGAELVDITLPHLNHTRAMLWTITGAEAAEFLEPLLRTNPDAFHPVTRGFLERARLLKAVDYVHAQRLRQKLIVDMRRVMRDIDALVTPSTPIVAYPVATRTLDIGGNAADVLTWYTRFLSIFNLTGQPAMSIPCGFDRAGLPIGLQVVGHAHGDAMMLRVARAYERATDWHERHPPLRSNRPVVA